MSSRTTRHEFGTNPFETYGLNKKIKELTKKERRDVIQTIERYENVCISFRLARAFQPSVSLTPATTSFDSVFGGEPIVKEGSNKKKQTRKRKHPEIILGLNEIIRTIEKDEKRLRIVIVNEDVR